jgi:hypothetical protein
LACSEKTKPESGNDAGNEKSDGNLGVCLVVESFWMKWLYSSFLERNDSVPYLEGRIESLRFLFGSRAKIE